MHAPQPAGIALLTVGVGSGHSVTALYVVRLRAGAAGDATAAVRWQDPAPDTDRVAGLLQDPAVVDLAALVHTASRLSLRRWPLAGIGSPMVIGGPAPSRRVGHILPLRTP